jgi:hypothetical protein
MWTWIESNLFGFERVASPGERLHLRLFEALVVAWTLDLVWTWAWYIPRLREVVLPLGLARWLDVRFMFGAGVSYANAALVSAALVLGAWGRARPAYGIALLGFHLQYVARFSLGKVSHGSSLIGLAVLGLALGALISADGVGARRFAFGFTVALSAIGYTSAAICKLIATGPRWISAHHLQLWIEERAIDGLSKTGQVALNPIQRLLADTPWLASLTLAFGLCAEALAWLGFARRLRPWVFGALIAMHLGIWISMDILFDANVSVLLVLGLPWQRWLAHLRSPRGKQALRDAVGAPIQGVG